MLEGKDERHSNLLGTHRAWRAKPCESPPLTSFLDSYAASAGALAQTVARCLDRSAGGNHRLRNLYESFRALLDPELDSQAFAEEYARGVAMAFLTSHWCFDEEPDRARICAYLRTLGPVMESVFSIVSPGAGVSAATDRAADALIGTLSGPLGRAVPAGDDFDVLAGVFERFLDRSAPGLRARRGIYLTPRPLASYVVRSVDLLLRTRFGIPFGIGDPAVRLLDPAAGLGIFLEEAILLGDVRGGSRCLRPAPELSGYELMLPAYVVARITTQVLSDLSPLRQGHAPSLYLTDALSDPRTPPGTAPLLESDLSAGVRLRAAPVSVVVGNPPFSGHSHNRGRWITGLLSEGGYHPQGERNTKWLQDDYVKFLRLAQWTIEQHDEGVIGLVVNHNCLDALTFSGLRRSLLDTFEEIYVLDLHGNGRKRERTRSGSADENVFTGVAQGIAVLFLVKKAGLTPRTYRADLYGTRKEKLRTLDRRDLATTRWREIPPAPGPAILRSRRREFALETS